MVKTILRYATIFIAMSMISSAQQQATPEFIQKEISQGKQYCIVLLKQGKNPTLDSAKLVEMQMSHLQNLFSLKLQGKLSIFGPITENVDLRGICIFNLADKEEVVKLLNADPYIKTGALTYEVYQWFSIPGYALP